MGRFGLGVIIVIFAQSEANLDPISIISTVGFPIFTFLALGWYIVSGRFHSASEVEVLKAQVAAGEAREERLENQRDSLIEQYQTVVLPTINSAVQTFGNLSTVTERSTASVAKVEQTVATLVAALELAEKLRQANVVREDGGSGSTSSKRRPRK